MKYLAILKDSLREAIDSKVFYVMVGLSCLLVVLVGSVSFRPVPADEALPHIVQQPAFYRPFQDRGRSFLPIEYSVQCTLEGVEAVKEPRPNEPQTGDYRFTLVVTNPDSFYRAIHAWTLPPHDLREARERDREESAAEEVTPAGQKKPDAPVLKKKTLPDVPESVVDEFIRDQFATVGNVEVASVERLPSGAGDPSRYRLQTRGTEVSRGWLHEPVLFFGAWRWTFLRYSLGWCVYFIEDLLVNGFGAWIGILVGVVITAFFIPNMLRKGTVDLLLVKPIHRTTLLVYKFIGGLTFIFLNSTVAVVGIWLVLGLRSGIWATGFLVSILVLTFFFAILYSVSALFGVLTRSAIVSILMTSFLWGIIVLVGMFYTQLDAVRNVPPIRKEIPDWVYRTVDTAHFVLPRTKDLDLLTTRLLSREVLTEGDIRQRKMDYATSVTWGESLTASFVFIAIMLGLACWRFATKDY